MYDKLPERAVIVGAGALGVEFAYVWANYGVDVTIVEYMPQLLLARIQTQLKSCKRVQENGCQNVHWHRCRSSRCIRRRSKVSLSNGETITCDQVLMAVGFAPKTDGVGLEAAGVQLNEFGAIGIDDQMRQRPPSIYAIGDCAVELRLAHVGVRNGYRRCRSNRRKSYDVTGLSYDAQSHLLPTSGRQLWYTEAEAKIAAMKSMSVNPLPA